MSGIWSGTRSGAAMAPAVYHVGMAHQLPGADAGYLIAISVVEYGTWPLNCNKPLPGQPWRSCWQLTTTAPDRVEGLVRFLPLQASPEEGLSYRSARLDGEFRFEKPPVSTWRIDFRAGLPPTARGRFGDAVTFVPGSGTAPIDVSYSGTANFAWTNPSTSALTVHLEFPRVHSCGAVIVDLRDNGHDAVEGTIKCGSATLGRIAAADPFYAFTWFP